jgi:very-short-patch-repair endonuclease
VGASDKAYKRARKFRRELSLPEKLLWVRIRHNELNFRRQHPIGEYVLDFYCPAAKLAIEVDGAAHDFGDRPRLDERRTQWLKGEGVDVLRIPAKDVLRDPDEVADTVIRFCAESAKPLHHSPPASGPPPHELRSQGGAEK